MFIITEFIFVRKIFYLSHHKEELWKIFKAISTLQQKSLSPLFHAFYLENVYKATLPIGWTIIDTPTLAFSIYDDKKRLRATGEVSSIFTGMGLERRYNTSEQYDPCPMRLARVPVLGYELTKENQNYNTKKRRLLI